MVDVAVFAVVPENRRGVGHHNDTHNEMTAARTALNALLKTKRKSRFCHTN